MSDRELDATATKGSRDRPGIVTLWSDAKEVRLWNATL
jgi:hypothetical protein